MVNMVIIGVLLVLVGLAVSYIVKAKKSGVKCIGCPHAKNCSANSMKHTSCGCHTQEVEK